jgi:hypothetical protein
MEISDLFMIVIKTFILVLLLIYFLVGFVIARQIWLMNRAIRTKLAGCLNLLAIIHVFLILIILVITVLM